MDAMSSDKMFKPQFWKPLNSTFGGFLLLCVIATTAFGHDPGLSYVNLERRGDELTATAVFSQAEVRNLSLADALQISIDQKPITPSSVNVSPGESNSIRVVFLFKDIRGPITLQSPILSRLALGHRQFVTAGKSSQMLTAASAAMQIEVDRAASDTFREFAKMGVEHIWFGFDHLAFLFALLLAVANLRESFKIITSFTVAHSITLTAATLDLVHLPSSIVEPVIAVSIVYVGIENFLGKPKTNRILVTFAFGLVHGFGFSSALRELGIGSNAPLALFSFNAGVEFGQAVIAAVALPILYKLRQVPQTRYVEISSTIIALAGTWWLIQRIMPV